MWSDEEIKAAALALAQVDYGRDLEGMPKGKWPQYHVRAVAALNAVPRWRPIESAPKDGTPILVYSDGATNAVSWHGKDLGWQPVEPPYGEWWTPLPEPPTDD
jgi:hypothetical protein